MGTNAGGVMYVPQTNTTLATTSPPPGEMALPKIEGPSFVRLLSDGTLLVFAKNGAWAKGKSALHFQSVEHYPGQSITAISQVAPDDSIWMAQAAETTGSVVIGRVKVVHDIASWKPHETRGLDAIGTPQSIFAEQNEAKKMTLWIGGTKGILRHVVENGPSAPRPRSPLLHAFAKTKSDTRQPITDILGYSTSAIEFEFAAPEYARRASLRLQTKIDGIDTDWVPASRDSRRELTAIRDGRYTFQVRAVAETGVASEPTMFTFEVAPPWWRTQAAIGLEAVALVLIVFGGYRLRVRALQRRTVVLEQKVAERTEQLAEASAAKTMFVANMSHDIRNPLNGIVGLTLALEDTRLDPQQRAVVATLRECTTYLSSLVDDVLDFASIEAGRIELRTGPFVPAQLLNSVVTALKGQAAERGAMITIETDPDIPPTLLGDAGRIQQILVNYVSNALKYASGHIRLVAALAANAPGEIEFYVADEGQGIGEEEQKTLFTKFSRLEGARREHIPGTGLGLASCRLLADAMGGSVGVESKPGHGSRFFLRLPLTIALGPDPVPADVPLPKTSVLLVEDTDYNAMAATAVLSRLGLTCDRARNGEEAVRMFADKRYNIVLLDRNLPDIDGTEVARRMREVETDGMRSVLLAVTAYCTAQDRQLCLDAGMDAFVGKPLTPDKLRKVLLAAARQQVLGTASIHAPIEAAAPTPVANATSELDTKLLEYLADGAEGGLTAQAERFIEALDEAHAQMLAVSKSENPSLFGDAAHRILGHARMIGASGLVAGAIELETAARKSDATVVAKSLHVVEREIVTLKAALRRRLRAEKV